jgi:hypothetical protein
MNKETVVVVSRFLMLVGLMVLIILAGKAFAADTVEAPTADMVYEAAQSVNESILAKKAPDPNKFSIAAYGVGVISGYLGGCVSNNQTLEGVTVISRASGTPNPTNLQAAHALAGIAIKEGYGQQMFSVAVLPQFKGCFIGARGRHQA